MVKCITYSCPFVPAEWIAAHGFRPSRITPDGMHDEILPGAGICPYAQGFINEMTTASDEPPDAVIITTTCDQMRHASGIIAKSCTIPIFLMNVPTTWQTPSAHRFYQDELLRLSAFMQTLGAKVPDDKELAEVMIQYESTRNALRSARGQLPPKDYSEAIARFHCEGVFDHDLSGHVTRTSGIPIALVGGPLSLRRFGIFDAVEEAGGCIVLDATTTGERTLPGTFDSRRLRENPLQELVDAYFGTIPDAFRRPNSMLYQWLKTELSARDVRGILFHRYTWCDTWHGEAQRMKEWAPVPLFVIEAESCAPIDGRTKSRIQSFIEVLK